jgi:hypothetical protein
VIRRVAQFLSGPVGGRPQENVQISTRSRWNKYRNRRGIYWFGGKQKGRWCGSTHGCYCHGDRFLVNVGIGPEDVPNQLLGVRHTEPNSRMFSSYLYIVLYSVGWLPSVPDARGAND